MVAVCKGPPCSSSSVLAVAFLHNHAGHVLDAVGSVVLVVSLPGDVLQILHVCANEHVPQLHEVTVGRVLHCKVGVRGSVSTSCLHRTSAGNAQRKRVENQRKTGIRAGGASKGGLYVHVMEGRGPAYLPRCPRDRDGLAPASLWPPPPCCCRSRRRGCSPCWGNRKRPN